MKSTQNTRTYFLLFSIAFSISTSAQDIHFSQFYRAPVNLNPAAAGDLDRAGRVNVLYRGQWQNVEKGFVTYYLSADMQLKPKWMNAANVPALGIQIYKDIGGEFKFGHLGGSLILADHIKVADGQKVSFAIRCGFGKTAMETANWQWGSQYSGSTYDPALPGETPLFFPKSYLDAGAGVQYTLGETASTMSSGNQQWLRIGLSANHLNRPRENSYADSQARQSVRYLLNGSSYIGINNNSLALLPAAYVEMQAGAREVMLGTNFLYRMRESSRYTNLVESNGIGFGLFFRLGDAIIPSVYYESERIMFGLSYDVNVSSFNKATNKNGGFEISLRYGIRSLGTD